MALRTYLDANVLIAAFRGEGASWRRAMEILDDPVRGFLVSDYLRLEVLPKPTSRKYRDEIEFMNAILDQAEEVAHTSTALVSQAEALASKYDLGAIDALHVAAAVSVNAEELITLEKPTKPICQVRELKVVSIYQAE